MQAGQRLECSRLNEKAGVRAHDRSPGVFVPRVLRDANDLNAPVLSGAALVAQALEGDAHLDFIAPGSHVAGGLVDVVRIEIDHAIEPESRVGSARRAGEPFTAHAALLDAERV